MGKSLTNHELIHNFVHVDNLKRSNGRLRCYNNKLYYYDNIVAEIIDRNEKKVIIKMFSNRGSFGNGLGYFDIVRAFRKEWKVLIVSEIKYDLKETLECAAIEYIKKTIEYNKNVYAAIYGLIIGKFKTVKSVYKEIDFSYLNDFLLVDFGLDKSYIENYLNNLKDVKYVVYRGYKGWSQVDIKLALEKPINEKLFFYKVPLTKKQIKIYNSKVWILNTFYKHNVFKNLPYKKKMQIALNIKERRKWNNKIKEIVKERQKEEKEYQKKVKYALNKIIKENVQNWRLKGGIFRVNKSEINKYINESFYGPDYYIYPRDVYLRIKNNNFIETSLGVTIKLTEAKKLYDLFKKTISKLKPNTTKHFDSVFINKIYKLDNITKGKTSLTTTLTIGCHTITQKEINDFIKFYKLKW